MILEFIGCNFLDHVGEIGLSRSEQSSRKKEVGNGVGESLESSQTPGYSDFYNPSTALYFSWFGHVNQ